MNGILQSVPQSIFPVLRELPIKTPKEPELTRAIQNTLVPSVAYRDMHVEAYGRTIPHEDVGGDLVDLLAVGGGLVAYVADVSGHGLSAGVLMGMVKTAMRYGLHLGQSLPAVLGGLNRVLPAVKEPHMYATLGGLRFDGSNEVEYVSAGHVPLLQYRRRHNDIVHRSIAEFPLGMFEGATYVSTRFRYEAGDLFVLLTDGVVEVADSHEAEFGLERLEHILCNLAGHPLAVIFDAALSAITRHGIQHDDQTLLLIRTLPSSRHPRAELI